jgi:ABC-type spermidine/putrescine transport system permease subunit II
VLGLLIAWLLARTSFRGQSAFEFGALLAFAIPGTVLGVSYVLVFNVPPFELTGTALIIVLCFVFRSLPVGVRAGAAAFKQIDRSLDEASTLLHARTATTLRRIVLPLLKPALVAALVYSFVRSMTTVSAVIFLVTAENELATTYIIGRVGNGDYGVALAYCTVLIVLMSLAVAAIQGSSASAGSAGATRRRVSDERGPGPLRPPRASRCAASASATANRPSAPLAVNDVSFEIAPGTLTTLLGPSGCGKTTLLRMIAGLEAPSAGSIWIGGRDATLLGPPSATSAWCSRATRSFPTSTCSQRRLRPRGLGRRQARGARAGARGDGRAPASSASMRGCRASSRAGSSSASRSPARSSSSPRCCSSTSRSRISTRGCAARCARRSAPCSSGSA